MALRTLDDLLIEQMRDLLDAEHRILKALPKMAKAATNADLTAGFKKHHAETVIHVKRLEQAFKQLGHAVKRKTCNGIKGLLKEGDEFLTAKAKKSMDADVLDAGLIASAQRVEHYEMAGYGCARAYARRLGHKEVAELLDATLQEEGATDKKLTEIAEGEVNPAAEHEGHDAAKKEDRQPAHAM